MVYVSTVTRNRLASLFVLLTLAGCGTSDPVVEGEAVVSDKRSKSDVDVGTAKGMSPAYRKPGAEIRFQHDFDGSLEEGVAEQVELRFTHTYSQGILELELRAEEGLELLGMSPSETFVFEGSEDATITVMLLTRSPGKFYLNIFANIVMPDAVQGRAFALAVGTSDYAGKASVIAPIKDTASKDNKNSNVVELPAQETISNR